ACIAHGSLRMDRAQGATMNPQADACLNRLLFELKRRGYRFVTITPASHARVVARPDRREGSCLEDVLGWSLPFRPQILDPELLGLMAGAAMRTDAGEGRLRATLRVSELRGDLYLHSAYPTDAEDAVFFGPDSYRFAEFIAREAGDRAL